MIVPSLTLILHSDWSVVIDPPVFHYEILGSLISESALPPCCFSEPSQHFWEECLIEVLESVWVLFPLFRFDQTLWGGIPPVLSPLVNPLKTCHVPVCCLHFAFIACFMVSWSGLWRFSTMLKYYLTCSTVCLVCISVRGLVCAAWPQWVCPSWYDLLPCIALSAVVWPELWIDFMLDQVCPLY